MASITNYKAIGDWFYILTAVVLVDFVVILLAKYPSDKPLFAVGSLNAWYDAFGLAAVAADVFSIAIGIAAARYIVTSLNIKGLLSFLAVIVAFQLAHDIFFYTAIIQPMPPGHNKMIDIFKSYGKENGAKILVSDALMMLASVGIAMGLKGLPAHITTAVALITLYGVCYAIYTRDPVTLDKIGPKA
jgi:hypothetical protein